MSPPAESLPAPPACLRCGVCCFSDLATYVRVTGADWTRLGAEADRAAHFLGHRAYLKMTAGHCAALALRPATGEYFCTIYDRRPQICRDLCRGTPACAGERAAKAPRPPAALARADVPSRRLGRCGSTPSVNSP